jgi:hypothetical protein
LLELAANEDRVCEVFQIVLGRRPDEEERVQSLAYLDQRGDHPEAAVRQLEWALLTSSEFLINH